MAVRAGAVTLALLGAILLPSAQNDPVVVSFSRNVAPILTRNCVSCHGPALQQSQFDLSTRASALKGGQKVRPSFPGTPRAARCING